MTDSDSEFAAHRGLLFGIAYRMLGSVADAEDIVQDCWLRWHAQQSREISNARAYLTRIVTTLSIDALRRARRQREAYSGPWLPEPLATPQEYAHTADGEQLLGLAETLSVALLVMLENLQPHERATFVLREAFVLNYKEIGECLNADAATCRQWAHRARQRLDARAMAGAGTTSGPRASRTLCRGYRWGRNQ